MYQHTFSAALAEQHRADLMAAAERARDSHRARPAGHRSRRLRQWRFPRPIGFAITRRWASLRNAI